MVTLWSRHSIKMPTSNANIDFDGFQKVKSKRSSKHKTSKIPPKHTQVDRQDVVVDVDKVIQRITSAVEDIKQSSYFKDFHKSVSNIIQERNVIEIVCFGLGHISECNISKHQLALLLCLKEQYNSVKVLIHDPIFYKDECRILNKLGCEVILENKEGDYVISDKGLTIVYLPHCPKQLTNNFLWSNWGINLSNCVLICNSFNSLIDSQPSRILSETVPHIFNIFPHITEHALENTFKFTDIFNDTSIHSFPRGNLEKLDPDFWKNNNKPSYENTEEFITSLMISKLNI